MNCKGFEAELVDLVLTPGAMPSVAAVAHMQVCPPCSEEYVSFQQTFEVLDAWRAPEPTPFFDQKLAVLLREEQAAPRMGWLERLTTRLSLNTGRNFRPAMAGALSLALIVGGGSVFLSPVSHAPGFAQASATVNDLQIMDRNAQAFQQLDELQQDADSGSNTNQDNVPTAPPTS